MIRFPNYMIVLVGLAALAGCVVLPERPSARQSEATREMAFHQVAQQAAPAPMPLRVPIKGVMAGMIDFSAHGVFVSATSETPLTEDDWLAAGLASINLVGAASLVTMPGTGPHDAEWVADPPYRRWARAMQEASILAGAASVRKDREALLSAANRLASACQSCHDIYRPDIPSAASQFAAREPS